MKTYSLNEEELAEYCRSKGIFREDIEAWRQSCMSANLHSTNKPKNNEQESKEDKKRIKELEKELKRKEKALAEAAALLMLRKNANAIWGENEDE